MAKKSRWTPDEFRAYMAEREAGIQRLRERVERIRAELAAKRKAKPA